MELNGQLARRRVHCFVRHLTFSDVDGMHLHALPVKHFCWNLLRFRSTINEVRTAHASLRIGSVDTLSITHIDAAMTMAITAQPIQPVTPLSPEDRRSAINAAAWTAGTGNQ